MDTDTTQSVQQKFDATLYYIMAIIIPMLILLLEQNQVPHLKQNR